MNSKPKLSKREEVALLHRALAGDGKALSALYSACFFRLARDISNSNYRRGVYKGKGAIAVRINEPYDLAQDAFFKLLRVKTAKNITDVRNYLFMIASNTVHNEVQRQSKMSSAIIQYLTESFEDEHIENDTEEKHSVIMGLITEALANVTPLQAEIWKLFHIDGIPQTTIAEIRGVSRNTIKKHVYDATMRIREYINDNKLRYA